MMRICLRPIVNHVVEDKTIDVEFFDAFGTLTRKFPLYYPAGRMTDRGFVQYDSDIVFGNYLFPDLETGTGYKKHRFFYRGSIHQSGWRHFPNVF